MSSQTEAILNWLRTRRVGDEFTVGDVARATGYPVNHLSSHLTSLAKYGYIEFTGGYREIPHGNHPRIWRVLEVE